MSKLLKVDVTELWISNARDWRHWSLCAKTVHGEEFQLRFPMEALPQVHECMKRFVEDATKHGRAQNLTLDLAGRGKQRL